MAFVVDEDAYYMLKRYLEDVGSRFEPEEQEETMNDVEMRIADIFSENLASPRQIVGVELVRRAISIIGKAEEFGERKENYSSGGQGSSRRFDFSRGKYGHSHEGQQADIRKLRRSVTDRVIGGICGGLAKYFGIDVALIRIVMFILIFFGGLSLWIYIILWVVIPPETEISDN